MDDQNKYTASYAPVGSRGGKDRSKWTAISVVGAVVGIWLLYSLLFSSSAEPEPVFVVKKAIAVLSGDSKVTGTVTFTQSTALGPVTISGEIKNLDANAKRGFHIHQLGDATSGCTSAGSHFNPFGQTHGAPTDTNRHVGDLGNIQSNSSGFAVFSFTDKMVSLNGPLSIIGRSVVVHAGTDDLGKGGDEESLKTGNAGGRSACGVIGLAELV